MSPAPVVGTKARAIILFMLVAAFSVLIFGGTQIARYKPPIPERVVNAAGETIFTGDDVIGGQKLYLSRGGQHMGSIWGHGAYLAPDWSADALHRIGLVTAGTHEGFADPAQFTQDDLDAMAPGERGRIEALVSQELRENRYDAAKNTLVLSAGQDAAFAALAAHYTKLFREGNANIGVTPDVVRSDAEGKLITSFFFWTAWAAGTTRPDADHTYTANWPHDPLVGNQPTPGALIWSIVSVIVLIAGVAVALFLYLRFIGTGYEEGLQFTPFSAPTPTASQRSTLPYFVVVAALFFVQSALGSITGHYAVEGNAVFGVNMQDMLPYVTTRTWHVQLSVYWIATAWLATGLFIGPFVSGHEPKGQALWVKVLFGALVAIVVGSLVGTYASIKGVFGSDGFLFGHQGYEYIELGRVWQIGLIVGMVIWLVLVYRAIKPTLAEEKDKGGLTHLLLYSSVTIPLFYAVGLFYTPGTHMSVADYWRWWVVHLWVEGFFEVFATVAIAFVLSRIGAVRQRSALVAIYFSVVLYLGSGVIGTFHHLYFAGTPTFILALGGVFSALEVVPLTLLGFEVFHNLNILKRGGENFPHKWPVYFFVAVAFWNLVGAGIFGFLINPPIVLYYAQGLNTTPIHSHAALFGVYGFLAIALMLFSLRHTVNPKAWDERLLSWSFWGLNLGLVTMLVVSLIPAGFYQFLQSIRYGTWYARSEAVTGSDFIHTVTWLRLGPDVIFLAGALALVAFTLKAVFGGRNDTRTLPGAGETREEENVVTA